MNARTLVSLLTACLVSVLPAAALVAQEPPAPARTWTLEQCLTRAMEKNPSIRAARLGIKAASGANQMALSEFMPRIAWNTLYIKNDTSPLGSLSSTIPGLRPSMSSEEYYTSSLSADLTLFSWRMKPIRSAMKATGRLARLKRAAAENDLTLQVRKAFYTVLYAQQLSLIAQSAENVARDNLTTSENLYRVGRVSAFDVSRAKVRVVNARTEVIAAKNFEIVSYEGLRMLLSLPADEAMTVDGTFLQEPRDLSLDDAIAAAVEHRPDLDSARQVEILQKASREQARAGFLPTISAGFSYLWEGTELTTDMDRYYTSWTAKAGINIPLFDGLMSVGSYRAQTAKLEQAREQVRSATDGVLMEVRQSYYSLASARESVQAQVENVSTAEENLRIAQERYKMGLLSLLDLKDAELSLITARTQQIKSLYDYTISLASLDRAVGLPADGNN